VSIVRPDTMLSTASRSLAKSSIEPSDLEAVDSIVSGRTIDTLEDYAALQQRLKDKRKSDPMIADSSVDLVVSNCVINLVDTDSKNAVLEEIFRVLRPGGRIALSDNVSNVDVPEELKSDPELWVGCYSGVYQEQAFYKALQDVGFIGLNVEERKNVPEKTIGDVTFHSVTVTATKPVQSDATEGLQVMYKGPWSSVTDDSGTSLPRGEAVTLPADTAQQLRHATFANHLHFLNEATADESGC
ncbi:MAG: methyltransferase domain-containing protein, partial [Pseudomonadota bacterium]